MLLLSKSLEEPHAMHPKRQRAPVWLAHHRPWVAEDHLLLLPAWLARNRPTGGAVFSRRTPGNQPYPPPADPPRQALPSLLASCSLFF